MGAGRRRRKYRQAGNQVLHCQSADITLTVYRANANAATRREYKFIHVCWHRYVMAESDPLTIALND